MKKNHYIFLSQLVAATQSNKQFFVSKRNRESFELSAVFIELNIIKKITPINNKVLRSMPKRYRDAYCVFWLKDDGNRYQKPITKFEQDPSRGNISRNTWFYNRISINKPSRFHKNKVSYKELLDIKPSQNTIYIMFTVKGIITSQEAIKHRVGGFILCTIYL